MKLNLKFCQRKIQNLLSGVLSSLGGHVTDEEEVFLFIYFLVNTRVQDQNLWRDEEEVRLSLCSLFLNPFM